MAIISDDECSPVARIYNCQGEEISPDGEGTPLDEVYLTTEKERSPWIYSLQASQPWNARLDTTYNISSSARTMGNPGFPERLVTAHDNECKRLPEHLCCMLPPVGIQTTDELGAVVDLVLEYQDIFIGPDGKVNFTHCAKHTIDV